MHLPQGDLMREEYWEGLYLCDFVSTVSLRSSKTYNHPFCFCPILVQPNLTLLFERKQFGQKQAMEENRIGRKALDQNPLDENWAHGIGQPRPYLALQLQLYSRESHLCFLSNELEYHHLNDSFISKKTEIYSQVWSRYSKLNPSTEVNMTSNSGLMSHQTFKRIT